MTVPENWWKYHHQDCGTKYRGCHPTLCPKENYEKTGEWKEDRIIKTEGGMYEIISNDADSSRS